MSRTDDTDYECKDCRRPVDRNATECPSCGARRRRRPVRLLFWLATTLFLALSLTVALAGGLVGGAMLLGVLVLLPASKLSSTLFLWAPVAVQRKP